MKRSFLFTIILFCVHSVIAQVPVINSFSPVSGPVGSVVTITGTNFNTTPANNIVFFGAVRATIQTATGSSISVVVPAGATYQPISITTNKLTAYSAMPFLVTFTGNLGINPHTFAYNNNLATDFTYSYGFSDIDGDGKPDIVSNNSVFSSNQFQDSIDPIYVFRNVSTSGSILFSKPYMVANSRSETFTATGDLDGDGKQDIVFVNSAVNGDSFSIAKNTSAPGSVSFAKPVSFATTPFPGAFAIGDLNGDGKPDIVVANTGNSNFLSVYQNTTTSVGNISLALPKFLATNGDPYAVLINDLDGDGKSDIIISDGTDSLEIFKNTSTGGVISFAPKLSYAIGTGQTGGGIAQPSIALGDIDGNGKMDIVCTANINYVPQIAIFRNTSMSGTISFATQVNIPTSCDESSVAVNDLDGDGKPDIIIGNCYDVAVLKNNSTVGNIALSSEINYGTSSGGSYGTIASADLDGDGKPDIGASDNGFSLYLNTPTLCTSPSTINTLMPTPLSIEWLRTYGGLGDNEATCVTAATDSTFIASGALHLNEDSLYDDIYDSADAYMVKYSTNGNIIWQKTIAGNKEDFIYSVAKAANGGFIAVGTTRSNTGAFSSNHGASDLWVIKLDSAGNILWQKLFGGSNDDGNSWTYAPVIRKTPDNNYIILANTKSHDGTVPNTVPIDTVNGNSWLIKINESGTVIWQKVYPDTIAFYDLQATPDRCFMLPGNATDDSSYTYTCVIKMDSIGNILFRKNLNNTDVFETITANSDSTYTLAGYVEVSGDTCTGEHGSAGNYDLPVMRIDNNGNPLWKKYFGGSNDDAITGLVNSVIQTNDGGNLITGYTYSNDGNVNGLHDTTGLGYGDGWMFKLDAQGNLQWQRPVGGTGDDYLDGVIQLSTGDYIVTGSSSTQNDGDIYGVTGTYDAIVFRVGPGISFCPSSDTAITSNITGSSYQWQVNNGNGYTNISNNANYSGIATQTLHLIAPPSSWYGYTYRCIINGGTYSEATILKFSEQWVGAVSNAWENPSNWSCGVLPDANTDVIVKGGNVVLSSNQTVRSLSLYNGATITIKANDKLTLVGKQ